MEAPTGISFTILTINQLKEFFKKHGVTVANNMNKQNIVCLCQAAKSWIKTQTYKIAIHGELLKENWLILTFLKICCYFTICLHLHHLFIQRVGLIDIFNYLLFRRAHYDQKNLKHRKVLMIIDFLKVDM